MNNVTDQCYHNAVVETRNEREDHKLEELPVQIRTVSSTIGTWYGKVNATNLTFFSGVELDIPVVDRNIVFMPMCNHPFLCHTHPADTHPADRVSSQAICKIKKQEAEFYFLSHSPSHLICIKLVIRKGGRDKTA